MTLGSQKYTLRLIGLVGIPPQDWLISPDEALPTVALMGIWSTAGYYMILWLAGLQSVPEELEEAARIDGAGRWNVFWSVTLPLLKPTTIFIAMTSARPSPCTFRTCIDCFLRKRIQGFSMSDEVSSGSPATTEP